MQFPGQGKPPVGVVFDSALDGVDDVLALALLYGLEGKTETRVAGIAVSRNNLKAAAFCDAVSRFYAGEGSPFFGPRPAPGMSVQGRPAPDLPLFTGPLAKSTPEGKPLFPHNVEKLNDTAIVAAVLRNALTAQYDQNAVMVLSGPAGDLIELMTFPGVKDLITHKVKFLTLTMAGVQTDMAAAKTLFEQWPTPIVACPREIGEALPFPSASIEKDFAWSPAHPVADAYRAAKPFPYDAPSGAMAASLYAIRPQEGYFKLSDPGTISVLDNGRTNFTPSAGGKHRNLIFDPEKKEQILRTYTEIASARPVPRVPRRFQKKPEDAAPKPAIVPLLLLGALAFAGSSRAVAADTATFDKTVRPLLTNSCSGCHNDDLASGGLNLKYFSSAQSLTQNRDGWEIILRKVKAGEMPPKGIPRPPVAQVDGLVRFVQAEFDRADRNVKPDPGRVTAHRLNRNEYSNTIRDLLAVEFHAEKIFPTDDSGDGFDNISDVLTISPVLMEKYMTAAERIAARAIGADPLPKPVQVDYAAKDKRIRRPDLSTIEATHRIDFDGEYVVRFGLPGERAADAKPVELGFWMDGKLLHSMQVETKPSKLIYFNPYSEEQVRLYLPEGDHVFRAGFINDDFVKGLSEKAAYSDKKNKFLNSIVFVGPYPSKVEKASRKRILTCDPNSGPACVDKIISTLAHRAYRRPVTRAEVASLMKFVNLATADGQTSEQGVQLAIQAMLVSPNFLFRIERDPADASAIHKISSIEAASRLSYFLWSSMPDDELLNAAETGKLSTPGALDAQVKRMLADPRASAFADNFAGQWLETRNLDVQKPDPQKFPEWGPELRDAMKTETRMFFEYVLRENRPVSDFLDAKYTFLNEMLAKFYGIDGVQGPDFRRVELTTNQRGGILGQASVLTVSSYATRTSPVIRGQYVLRNILASPAPPPPPDVPLLDEAAVGNLGPLRQQLEKHRANATCASCHSRMDPLGFGLENYDAIGRWRAMDGKFPIDASGTLPNGKSFTTPAEMRAILISQLPEFSHCLIERMLTYALGRGLKPYDRRTVDNIDKEWAASGYRFQTLVYEIVRSFPFQSRRGEVLETKNIATAKETVR